MNELKGILSKFHVITEQENEIFISGTWTSNTGKRIAVLSPSKGYPQDDYKLVPSLSNNENILLVS